MGPDGEAVGVLVGPEGAVVGAGVTSITTQLVLPLVVVVIPAAHGTQGVCPEGLKYPTSQALHFSSPCDPSACVVEPNGQA